MAQIRDDQFQLFQIMLCCGPNVAVMLSLRCSPILRDKTVTIFLCRSGRALDILEALRCLILLKYEANNLYWRQVSAQAEIISS